jgi:hypothetical protein
MKIEKLSKSLKELFIKNGNEPLHRSEALTRSNALGRRANTRDYMYVAFVCPSLKGFYNWQTHVKHGIKATIVRERAAKVVYKEGLEIFDELVYRYYEDVIDVQGVEPNNADYYAGQCMKFVYLELFRMGKIDLVMYMPVQVKNLEALDEYYEDSPTMTIEKDERHWIYVFRHPKIKTELKIGMTTRHWKQRYAEANASTYTSRDLEVLATFPCSDGISVERFIHSQFEKYRLPPKKGQKKRPEWFEFPEEKIDEVIKHIGDFIKTSEKLLTI